LSSTVIATALEALRREPVVLDGVLDDLATQAVGGLPQRIELRPACDSLDIQRQYDVRREVALARDVIGLESDAVRVLEEH